MKKYIISVAVAVTLIVAGGYGAKSSLNPQLHLSDLAKANIEALSAIELPEFEFTCGAVRGFCWDWECRLNWTYFPPVRTIFCTVFTGSRQDYCLEGALC